MHMGVAGVSVSSVTAGLCILDEGRTVFLSLDGVFSIVSCLFVIGDSYPVCPLGGRLPIGVLALAAYELQTGFYWSCKL